MYWKFEIIILADTTARSMIGYCHDSVVCLFVLPPVCYEVYCGYNDTPYSKSAWTSE